MPAFLHSPDRRDGSSIAGAASVEPDLPTGGEQEPSFLDEGLIAGSMHLIRRAGVVMAVQVVGAGLAYGQQVVLARLLGTSDYGIYAYVFVWVTFVALLAGLGFPAASVRFLPVYKTKKDWSRIHGFMRSTSLITAASAMGIALLAVVGAELLQAVGWVTHPSYIVIGAMLIPALAGSMLYTEIARAGHRVGIAFIPPQILRPTLIIAGAGAVYAMRGDLSANAALGATLASGYVVLAVQYAITRHLFGKSQPEHRPTYELREWFGVGVTLLMASVFIVTLLQVDIVIVGIFDGTRDAGLYAAASKTATLVAFVIMAVNAAAAPQFASLWALGRVDELQRLVTKLAGVIFWPSLAISVGIAALAGPLLGLFGPEFSEARPALLVLLVGQVINAGAGSVGYLLTLTGHHREATRVLGLSAVACVLLAAIGVWALGLVGAALGSSIGFLLWNGALYRFVVSRLGIEPSILNAPQRPHLRRGG